MGNKLISGGHVRDDLARVGPDSNEPDFRQLGRSDAIWKSCLEQTGDHPGDICLCFRGEFSVGRKRSYVRIPSIHFFVYGGQFSANLLASGDFPDDGSVRVAVGDADLELAIDPVVQSQGIKLVDNKFIETSISEGIPFSTASNHPTILCRPVEVPNSTWPVCDLGHRLHDRS